MDLNTITEIVRASPGALPAWREGDAYLAGGTWLFSEPQPQLKRLIDLPPLGLTPLRATEAGLEIAATCTIAQLDNFGLPAAWAVKPLIAQCCRAFLASFKIWNAATVGGNVCLSLPAGPMIALTAALDGVCRLRARDGSERQVAVESFVSGPQANLLAPGELLVRIDLPDAALRRRSAFRQISLSPLGRSAALLIGTRTASGGFVLTITASTPRPFKLAFDALPNAAQLRAAIEARVAGRWYDDVHGTPEWRRHMSLVLAEQIRAELAEPPR